MELITTKAQLGKLIGDKLNNNINKDLLEHLIICNRLSNQKYYLFCRHLHHEDLEMCFDLKNANKYELPYEYEADEFYAKAHWESMSIEGVCSIGGFQLGVYDSYDEALEAARSLTLKKLLNKYLSLYMEAVKALEKEDLEMAEINQNQSSDKN